MDYSTMEAGPEMDALVAERVMGFRRSIGDIAGGWLRLDEKNRRVWSGWLDREPTFHEGEDGYTYQKPLALMGGARFAPSTDTAAAFEVVDCVQTNHPGWRFSLLGGDGEDLGKGQLLPTTAGSGQWQAEFFGYADPKQNYGQRHGQAYADTRALAICRAALMAVEAQERTEPE